MDMVYVMAGLIPFIFGIYLLDIIKGVGEVILDIEDEDDELYPDTSGWFIIISFFIIGAWQSWGELRYYEFWSFIGFWIGVGLVVWVVDWIVDRLKRN